MRSQQIIRELILVVMTGTAGFISSWLLAGFGVFNIDLTAGTVCFGLLSGAIFPAATARVLMGPWWISALIFSFFFFISVFFQMLGQEWNRVLAGLGCIGIAFTSAWLFRLRPE